MARNYTTSDEFMVERSDTIQQLFNDNLAPFTLFDPELDAAFASAWQTAIDNAIAAESAETVDDQMQQLTEIVFAAMTACRKKYHEVKYYFGLAFPKNRKRLQEMGTDDFDKARNRQIRLVMFTENMHLKAEKYKVDLLAKGYTQAKIDEIDTLRQTLQNANKAQNAFIKGRPVLTEEREKVLNTCYGFTDRVCEAANSVFYEDDVMRGLFVFNPGGEAGESEFFEGELAVNEEKQVDDFTYNGAMHFIMHNPGAAQLDFYFKEAGAIVGTHFTLEPGETLDKTSTDFHTSGDSIWVRNTGVVDGAYEVEETI